MPYPSETLKPAEDRYPSDEDDEFGGGMVPYYLNELYRSDSIADDEEVLELIAHFIEAVDNA
jgi:hypothetical protein